MSLADIRRLIPQRDPILMVDELSEVEKDGSKAVCTLTVRQDNYFIEEEGLMAEAGLIEHIAQSASAFIGYLSMQRGGTEPPVGYIGEIKKFHCLSRPQVGDKLHTTITMGAELAGVTIISGETHVGDEVVADTQMKLYVAQDR